MGEAVAFILATLLTVPLLLFYFIYIISVKIHKQKKRALLHAADGSTIFFMGAVYVLVSAIWNYSLLWLFVLLLLVVASLFTWVHWKKYEEISLRHMLMGVWRFQFLLFFSAYVLLSFVGLGYYWMNYVYI
ncbi:DUF3397 domain-containing protein [Salsuginibacillus kocurii]|uniref:DUF3397 domain-containing protein n=1 Tax=Salsuginibacillus kocurii TaxID=427078 RepID=UPI000366876C|nr:DUF3397 domain-containing protein [Salsuginibacillus kocurii]